MNPIVKLMHWYFRRSALPYWLVLLLDCLIVLFSGVFVNYLFDGALDTVYHFWSIMRTLLVYLVLTVLCFRLFYTYAGVIRYSSFVDLQRVGYANILALVLCIGAHFVMCENSGSLFACISLPETISMFVVATLLMWMMRVLVKTTYEIITSNDKALRVLIFGTMSGGVALAKNIRSQRPMRYLLKGFITHDSGYRNTLLMGEKVYSVGDNLLKVIQEKDIQAVLVSPIRQEDFSKEQELQDLLINAGVKILLAQYAQEWDGDEKKIAPMQLKEVSVEDLLPRDEIVIDMDAVGRELTGKRILITGSAGSIGSEMVRQVAVYKPAAMMLIDQAETPQHDIRLMMAKDFPTIPAETVVTSICKKERMEEIFSTFRPDYVFHAAAYKHVPMMEDNPKEAVQNNVYGTRVIADLAVKYGTKKFVMISTDKAVNPTNVMGCSKRICEIYCQALNAAQALRSEELRVKSEAHPGPPQGREGVKNEGALQVKSEGVISEKSGSAPAIATAPALSPFTGEMSEGQRGSLTQFVTTRFGNVLGSNGSVIPHFREQIKNGGPVTVTHENIIRYFMLIPEACKLVLEAGTMGKGGEIFVFDMGKPVRIMDLAKRMIQLSGAKNIKIEVTGLRDGEKLFEEVLSDKEKTIPTLHPKIMVAKVREYAYEDILRLEKELYDLSFTADDMAVVKKMKEIVPEFKSQHSKYEALDK